MAASTSGDGGGGRDSGGGSSGGGGGGASLESSQFREDVDMFSSITGVSRPKAAAYVHEGQRKGDSLDQMIAKWFDEQDTGSVVEKGRTAADRYRRMEIDELLERASSGFSNGSAGRDRHRELDDLLERHDSGFSSGTRDSGDSDGDDPGGPQGAADGGGGARERARLAQHPRHPTRARAQPRP